VSLWTSARRALGLDEKGAELVSRSPATIDHTYLARRNRELKAAYAAAQHNRFRRVRTRLGGTADAHYTNASEFWRVREYVRDMDRNDAIIGQLVTRAVDNIVGSGFVPVPNTGDETLNAEITARWNDWANDPNQCDVTARMTFHQMEKLALRHTLLDGDIFGLLTGSGALQMLEGDMVDSPDRQTDDVVHGVEVNLVGKPLRYWIRHLEEGQRERTGRRVSPSDSGYDKRPAFDSEGNAAIVHVYDPKRFTQTRGISALAPVFGIAGMFEDLNFSKLVQQEISSCVAMFIERETDYQLGDRETSGTDILEEVSPGLIIRGKPGEKLSSFAPNVTSADWQEHIRLILRIIGAALGMPLTLVLLDTSATNFHGYRGELDQARLGFKCVQKWFAQRFHSQVYRWKVREWFPASRNQPNILHHRWAMPGWSYVDPLKDGQADALALKNILMSPREQQSRRGLNWETTVKETVFDREMMILEAEAGVQRIFAKTGLKIEWWQLLNMSQPDGVTISTQITEEADSGSGDELVPEIDDMEDENNE